MVKAIVVGAGGRMGKRIIHTILQTPGITLAGAVEKEGHPAVGRDVGELAGEGGVGVFVESDLDRVAGLGEVIVDFTIPEVSMKSLETAVRGRMALVIGTTGFSPDQVERIRAEGSRTRCVVAPNMSVGVNVMFKIVEEAARALGPDYDVEIIEAHHRFKRDAPSGTAMKLGERIARALGRDLERVAVWGRKGMVGERKPAEIGIAAVRAGDIVGDHTVVFGGIGERLELTHRAHSRDNFARGAVKAALWVVKQPEGLYDMQDVLGLRERRERA
ncbi:MAG: 4-hydroxy-tetrahydrodipicolinate reductase [Deltaproteobacteria bacterium]|nr:4-hydroxy-tetrahydrodipicolinate reductase [Deltaproteobacteria bacterium]